MTPQRSTEYPYVAGPVVGLGSYVLGYLVVYLWQAGNVREALGSVNAILEFFGGDPIPAWKAVGWLFYNAHFVTTSYPALLGGRTTRNFIAGGDTPTLLYLVPIVTLLGGGIVLAVLTDARTPRAGAIAGAFLTTGYAVAGIVGLFAFRVSSGGESIAPTFVTGLLLASVVLPAVLGAVGGAIGAVGQASLGQSRSDRLG
jgi:hypothetical protein